MRSHLTLVSVVPPDDVEPGEAQSWVDQAVVYHQSALAQVDVWNTYLPNILAGIGYGVTTATREATRESVKRRHPSRRDVCPACSAYSPGSAFCTECATDLQ